MKRIKVGQAELYTGDAREFLAGCPSASIDLVVSSPPYCMGKEFDRSIELADFITNHEKMAPELTRVLKPGGSLCWQVGHHVRDGIVHPLDAVVYGIFAKSQDLLLRNRIVWVFGHGVHARQRFSGRHETILWYTKGKEYHFNLDAVRVPQKYPGKRHYKGPLRGEWSGNPLGKNPSDVWEIPNVKAGHVEKTAHPCQFPVAMVQRLVRSLCPTGGVVADPFMGSGSAAVAALIEGRRFAGCDIKAKYVALAKDRITDLQQKVLKHRPIETPVHIPRGTEAVVQIPPHFGPQQ